jgi:hypothetical protein
MAGKLPCATVEPCTGRSVEGAAMVLRPAVLEDEAHPTTVIAIIAKPTADNDPRIQTIIGLLLSKA